MIIRDATADDAAKACAVLRASISDLCAADHHNDPDILSRWLANKTPENVAAWTCAEGGSLLVAVEDDAVLAVGGVRDSGEITANYVAPAARFRGVSAAMLAALEARAGQRGATRTVLLSTETAHRFYLSRGYRDDGPAVGKFGTNASYPMVKPLVTPG
ncbi:MAG: GNAT family N-acetyltransferase [Bradyrhizobium sp.]